VSIGTIIELAGFVGVEAVLLVFLTRMFRAWCSVASPSLRCKAKVVAESEPHKRFSSQHWLVGSQSDPTGAKADETPASHGWQANPFSEFDVRIFARPSRA
jgi:hypothetical protein